MMGWDWSQVVSWLSGTAGMMLGGLVMLGLWLLLVVLMIWGMHALVTGVDRLLTPGGPADGIPPSPRAIEQTL